jgi:adenylate cyclase
MLHADKAERLSPRDPERAWWSLGRATAEFVVGRYDEAVRWAKSAIEVAPSLPSGWRMLAASYAYLDRLDEARAAVEQLRRLAPQMTIEISRATVPAERSDYLEKYLQGLREAGLPE